MMKKIKQIFPDYIESYDILLIYKEIKGEFDCTQTLWWLNIYCRIIDKNIIDRGVKGVIDSYIHEGTYLLVNTKSYLPLGVTPLIARYSTSFTSRKQLRLIPCFFALRMISAFNLSVNFCRDIGRTAYVQKLYGDFGFGKKKGRHKPKKWPKHMYLYSILVFLVKWF